MPVVNKPGIVRSGPKAVGTPAQRAQWAAAQARLDAAGITGYTVGPGGITIAQANALISAQRRIATTDAQGVAKLARQQAADAIKAANAQAHQDRVAAVVAKNAEISATAVANQITNFQTHIEALVAQAGKGVLTPAFQARIAALQQQFATNIRKKGGAYTPLDLAGISPILQNSLLANQGVGLTNFSAANQSNAVADLYRNGSVAAVLGGGNSGGTPSDNGTPGTPTSIGSPTSLGISTPPSAGTTAPDGTFIPPVVSPTFTTGGDSGGGGGGSIGGGSIGGSLGGSSLIAGIPDAVIYGALGIVVILLLKKHGEHK
jgi:hypothetical protein